MRGSNGEKWPPIGGKGPDPIPTGRGKEWLKREEPYFDVHLDAGTFDWIWRIVESRAVQHANSSTATMLPEMIEVTRKAVIAFREAAGTIGPTAPTASTSPKRRKLVRVVKAPESG